MAMILEPLMNKERVPTWMENINVVESINAGKHQNLHIKVIRKCGTCFYAYRDDFCIVNRHCVITCLISNIEVQQVKENQP